MHAAAPPQLPSPRAPRAHKSPGSEPPRHRASPCHRTNSRLATPSSPFALSRTHEQPPRSAMGSCLSKGASAYVQHHTHKRKKPKLFSGLGALFEENGEEGEGGFGFGDFDFGFECDG
ncbi:hypothetical protein FGB62_169g010 [Gracilaria domingensis]|nr:hypothetical protein FGB62_169g010 [Gracilaria domingensis]